MKKFAEQILRLGSEKFPEFSAYGKFTFFLPVDSSFQVLLILSDSVLQTSVQKFPAGFVKNPFSLENTAVVAYSFYQNETDILIQYQCRN